MPRVTIPTLGQYGLVMDQAAQEIPDNAFSSIANVRFRDGMARESPGMCRCSTRLALLRTGSRPMALRPLAIGSTPGLRTPTQTTARHEPTSRGSAFTGAVDDRFTGGAFNGLFIINNRIDQPKYWDGKHR